MPKMEIELKKENRKILETGLRATHPFLDITVRNFPGKCGKYLLT